MESWRILILKVEIENEATSSSELTGQLLRKLHDDGDDERHEQRPRLQQFAHGDVGLGLLSWKKNVGVEIAAARNNPIQESHLQVAFLRCRPRFDSTPWVAAALQNKSEINRFFLKKFEDRFISLFLFLNYKFAIVLRVTPGCARAPTLAHRSKIPKRTPTKRKGL